LIGYLRRVVRDERQHLVQFRPDVGIRTGHLFLALVGSLKVPVAAGLGQSAPSAAPARARRAACPTRSRDPSSATRSPSGCCLRNSRMNLVAARTRTFLSLFQGIRPILGR
jgi:hypothetical protein